MAKPNKKLLRKIAKLCEKFSEDLQAIYDSDEMESVTYDTDICDNATMAQGYADDAASSLKEPA